MSSLPTGLYQSRPSYSPCAHADLLKRHSCRHSPSWNGNRRGRAASVSGRVAQACKACAASKLKCSDEKPCRRCERRNIVCEYEWHPWQVKASAAADSIPTRTATARHDSAPSPRTMLPPSSPPPTSSSSMSQGRTGNCISVSMSDALAPTSTVSPAAQQGPTPDLTMAGQSVLSSYHDNVLAGRRSPAMQSPLQPAVQPMAASYALLDMAAHDPHAMPQGVGSLQYTEFLEDLLLQGQPIDLDPCGYGTGAPLDTLDVESNIWAKYLDTVDMHPHDLPTMYAASQSTTDLVGSVCGDNAAANTSSETNNDDYSNNGTPSAASLEEDTWTAGARAFQTSGWNWAPCRQDTGSAEQLSLSMPDGWSQQGMAGLQAGWKDALVSRTPKLKTTGRHRILSTLLDFCEKEHAVLIATSFPSLAVLDSLMRCFLDDQVSCSMPWIHVPTFDPDTTGVCNELLTAVVAYGACLHRNKAIARFGSAIPNVLRNAVVAQIMRRAGWLRQDHYVSIQPADGDSAAEIQQKWHRWVQQESKKRLVYAVFMQDAQTSMMHLINPLMSFSEMNAILPEALELWMAPTACQWEAAYLRVAMESRTRRSLADNAYRAFAGQTLHVRVQDSVVSDMALLHGIWAMVCEHRQVADMLQMRLREDAAGSDLGASALQASGTRLPQRDSVLRLLGSVRVHIESSAGPAAARAAATSSDVLFLLEYLSLALHTPLQFLQTFAGKDGVLEARRVNPVIQEWARTIEARQAVWHAGQVLRMAQQMPPAALGEWRAILIMQAGLSLWVYGIVHVARQRSATTGASAAGGTPSSSLPLGPEATLGNIVRIDGAFGPDVRRFISLGDGVPAIALSSEAGPSSSSPARSILHVSAVMKIVISLLTSSATADWTVPPLVESICGLFSEMAKATHTIGLS
ncbi:hypothetical protein SBRCBS47491_004539 [Sporothrix bragantina]|uniref:Zn(2)-C6 fungal-type domain-containing protein n=1 Tax=Sporothrix bragantina TaxID=671064 RepID=A0ABP0BPD7_9PEZI